MSFCFLVAARFWERCPDHERSELLFLFRRSLLVHLYRTLISIDTPEDNIPNSLYPLALIDYPINHSRKLPLTRARRQCSRSPRVRPVRSDSRISCSFDSSHVSLW